MLFGGYKQRLNRIFFYLALSVAGWSAGLGLYYLSKTISQLNFSISLFYISAMAISHIVLLLALEHTGLYKNWQQKLIFASYAVLTLLIATADNFLIQNLTFSFGTAHYELNRLGYLVYSSVFIFQYCLALYIIYKYRQKAEADKKKQSSYLLAALSLSGIFGVFFNLILPWNNNFRYIWVGPMFSVVFLALVGLGINKAKLFDIKAAFARASAYSLSLISIAVVYGGTVYLIGEEFFGQTEVTRTVERFIFIIFAIFTAAAFDPLKGFSTG